MEQISEKYSAFKGFPWFSMVKYQMCRVEGVGGIGSWVTFFLGKLGVNTLYLVDPDKVEVRNLGGQLFTEDDIGMYKVDAVRNVTKKFGIRICPSCFTKKIQELNLEYYPNMHVFSCFDNMEARRYSFEKWSANCASIHTPDYNNDLYIRTPDCKNNLYMDGRLTPTLLQIYTFSASESDKISVYGNDCLPSDAEVPDTVCSMKQTSYSASMIGGFMTSIFVNHLTNLYYGEEVFKIPFKIEIDLESLSITSKVL